MGDEPREPPSDDAVLALPAGSEAPALARAYLHDRAGYLPQALLDDALILVSELVTNAVQHGRPKIMLRVRETPPGIGVYVSDGGSGRPEAPSGEPDQYAVRGRGLRIVDALASDWGVEQVGSETGKVVWFELGLDGA
ncbi:MAG TPA: ATP-binding protein [Jatrophihabitantaceae bacterium]|jgi:anti-sigma regulatory factor (Ser/Thr protein kinase)|nr:ATP-binding protein [Jatrophihabitantaceae bacterium]